MKRLAIFLAAIWIAVWPAMPGRADSDAVYVNASTSLSCASQAQRHNIALCCQSLSCVTLEYGDTFSFNQLVGPRSAQAGYQNAVNGRGVSMPGGGVAQVATTLYLALLQMDDIEYNSLSFYGSSFTGGYVSDGYYAVLVDYNNGVDFAFTSYCPGTITIFLWEDGETVSCLIGREPGNGQSMVGYAATPLYGSEGKINNISLACASIFGVTLNQYDMFSFNALVGPRLPQYGYVSAVNGRGVNVVGGGVAQAASTIYLAIKDLDCVTVVDKKIYPTFTEYYVSDPADAILTDYSNNVDFSFCYTGTGTLTLYTYLSADECICEVYEN